MASALTTDVLILGGGIAGGIAAWQIAEKGYEVILVTRERDSTESNTLYAQGGIIYRGPEDSPELLSRDIMRVGADYSYPPAVEILAHQGPSLVKELLVDDLEVPFNRNEDGSIEVIKEAGHSAPRIAHAADATGRAIMKKLGPTLGQHSRIEVLSYHTAVDLLTPSHHSRDHLDLYRSLSCVGAYILDREKKEVFPIVARQTVLATGGVGQIYLRTTNPSGARGDGLAMAYRAGARAINCEFVQFHPTTFYWEDKSHFLVSEAVRGAGARLVHRDGRPFMEKYAPEWKDLAPRDIVARSIHQEMIERAVPHVYLDLRSYLAEKEIEESFPLLRKNCREFDIDPAEDLVPVAPAAHYFCGGVWCDKWGQTTIDNLYAIGEVSCTGVHGANRMGSTSLLEGLVWGYRAAQRIEEKLQKVSLFDVGKIPAWKKLGSETPDSTLIHQDMKFIQQILWNYVGLVRNTRLLGRAIRELRHLETEIEDFYRKTELTDEIAGLRNAVRVALIVAGAAWKNKKSIGCHFRQED